MDHATIRTVYQQINVRAGQDAAFRADLKQAPAGAFARVAGEPLPEGYALTVVELRHDEIPLVLPPLTSGALSDDELDGVVGARNLFQYS